jgi:hypothetical protein
MKRNVGGREPILKNARQMSIVMGDDERDIITKLKGDSSISEFVRDSVLLRSPNTDQDETSKLRQTIIQQAHELDTLRNKEHILSKEREEIAAYIARDFELFKGNAKKAEDPVIRRRWLASRCKDTGVTPSDILCYSPELSPLSIQIKQFSPCEVNRR